MMKSIKTSVFSIMVGSLFLAACAKDKAVTSETTAVATTKDGIVYAIDTVNSKVEWKGYKVVKSDQTSHIGTITLESGQLTVKDNMLESGSFVVDMNSLTSTDLKDDAEQLAKLNGHLKSGDFFETEKFPTAAYEITKVTPAESGDYNTLLDGNLTMKGVTKPVQFKANVSVNNGEVTIATEPKDIKREDFGVKFQMPVANGVIKDDVDLQVFVKATEKK